MCNNLEKAYWFYEAGVSNIQFPRCYNFYQVHIYCICVRVNYDDIYINAYRVI